MSSDVCQGRQVQRWFLMMVSWRVKWWWKTTDVTISISKRTSEDAFWGYQCCLFCGELSRVVQLSSIGGSSSYQSKWLAAHIKIPACAAHCASKSLCLCGLLLYILYHWNQLRGRMSRSQLHQYADDSQVYISVAVDDAQTAVLFKPSTNGWKPSDCSWMYLKPRSFNLTLCSNYNKSISASFQSCWLASRSSTDRTGSGCHHW